MTIGNRREFHGLPGGGYVLDLFDEGVRLEVRHLRRERHQQYGELDVICSWAGAAAFPGTKSIMCGDINLSSLTQRRATSAFCAERSKVKATDFDWLGAIDEICRRVIQAERQTTAGIVLDDAPADGPPQNFSVHGFQIPADSHSQLVCDGDGLKSLTLLLVLGEMAKRGVPVCFLDYEWNAARHLQRKRRLFGEERIESLFYLRGRSSLAAEQDDIRRFCEERSVQFIGIDSIGACCDGKLADDDTARAYNRALDNLPPSLAAAHVPKGIDKDADFKAFGSAFFSNYTRQSWKLRKQVGASDDVMSVLYTPQKQNDGARLKPVCLEFTFEEDRIHVQNVDATGVEGFAQSLPLHARLTHLLKGGPMTIAAMASELGAKVDSVEKSIKRGTGKSFINVTGNDGITRWALLERRVA